MKKSKSFSWPDGTKAAVSFSFDDARPSQVDNGMAFFDLFPFKATFYVTPSGVEKRIPAWRQMVQKGHEIGNHSMNHPCSSNFDWAKDRAVEDYTLKRMEKEEILAANAYIQKTLGVKAKTYAYPCGHTYIGRGEKTQSLVPLISKHFIAGRGFRNEYLNDPLRCDMAQIGGIECDRIPSDEFKRFLDEAADHGKWVVFAGHDIAPIGRQATMIRELERTLVYLQEHPGDFWVKPVADVAEYVQKARRKAS